MLKEAKMAGKRHLICFNFTNHGVFYLYVCEVILQPSRLVLLNEST